MALSWFLFGLLGRGMTVNQLQLDVKGISLTFGQVTVLKDIDIHADRGEILAIIGPNGAGKTCLLNSISGIYQPQKGEMIFEGRQINTLPIHKRAEIGIARTFQNIELFTGLTVLDNILAARKLFFKSSFLAGAIYFGWTHREEIKQRKIAEEIIDFLEIEPVRKKPVGSLPYGLRKRVELGRALALEPNLLLLDEPMAGMNLEEKEDMVRFILDINEERGTTIMLIEHDMDVVMDISDRVVVLGYGNKIAEGIPSDVSANPEVVKAYLGNE